MHPMPDDKSYELPLPMALEVAVPLWIERFRDWPAQCRIERARECGDFVAIHGDIILYRNRTGEVRTAKGFNRLAEGIALGAYQPGGVGACGLHWCVARHPGGIAGVRFCRQPVVTASIPGGRL